jgi:AraC-like DNA-binding protein
MRYCQYAPSALLSRFVECFWSLESSADEPCAQHRIVADGRAEIILHLGEPPSMMMGKLLRKQGRRFLAGQMTRPLLLFPSGSMSVVGIRLRPAAAASWLGVPMSEFTDRMPAIDDLSSSIRHVLDSLDTDVPEKAIRSLDRRLSDFVRGLQPSARLEHAVDLVLRSQGAVRIERLAEEANLSRRQLERRFLLEVGLRPKVFARIIRFQNVFQAYESERDWVTVAHDCGYYDQAHLIQDFRELAGEPPTKLLARESDLAHAFLQASHFSKTRPTRYQ